MSCFDVLLDFGIMIMHDQLDSDESVGSEFEVIEN